MTPILAEKLHDLTGECGVPAVIYGIVTAVEAGARNFKYIAACARNHAAGVEPAKARASPGHRQPRLSDQERSKLETRARTARASMQTAEKFGGMIDPQWQQWIDQAKEAGVI